jgi:FolB domain-containing protein
MSDKIYIRDLLCDCIIGTNPDERVRKQRVVVNLSMECDFGKAGRSDDLADTLNYVTVKDAILAMLADSSYYLLEAMAERIAEICLSYQLVSAVTVTVDKTTALTGARSVAVEIRREIS